MSIQLVKIELRYLKSFTCGMNILFNLHLCFVIVTIHLDIRIVTYLTYSGSTSANNICNSSHSAGESARAAGTA